MLISVLLTEYLYVDVLIELGSQTLKVTVIDNGLSGCYIIHIVGDVYGLAKQG